MKIFLSAYKASAISKVISKLYQSLQNNRSVSTSYVKTKWEDQGNMTITEEVLLNTCKVQWETSGSHRWRLSAWKNIIRFFVTPVQESYNERGSQCWRQCHSEVANHHHIFWAFPVIHIFWKDIHRTLGAILKINIPIPI